VDYPVAGFVVQGLGDLFGGVVGQPAGDLPSGRTDDSDRGVFVEVSRHGSDTRRKQALAAFAIGGGLGDSITISNISKRFLASVEGGSGRSCVDTGRRRQAKPQPPWEGADKRWLL